MQKVRLRNSPYLFGGTVGDAQRYYPLPEVPEMPKTNLVQKGRHEGLKKLPRELFLLFLFTIRKIYDIMVENKNKESWRRVKIYG